MTVEARPASPPRARARRPEGRGGEAPAAAPRARLAGAAAFAASATLLAASGAHWGWQIGAWAHLVPAATGSQALDFALLALAVSAFFAFAPKRFAKRAVPAALLALLLAGTAWCAMRAWPHAYGALPWGIDHGATLFRVREMRAALPALGAWTPWWNAGTEHFAGVTSGAHGWALLNLPLFLALPPESWQAPALCFWLFAGFPWLTALVLRACGWSVAAQLSSALLSLAASRAEFLFFWQSGNLGAAVTAGLSPSLAALCFAVAVQRRRSLRLAAALAVVAALSCAWPPGLFSCAGMALGAAVAVRGRLARVPKRAWIAAAAALAALAPELLVLHGPARGIADYAAGGAKAPFLPSLGTGLSQLGRRLLEMHPGVLVFGFAALPFARRPRRLRAFAFPLFAVLAAVAVSVGFKRSSQFDRVAIQLAFAAVFPAALAAGRALRGDGGPLAAGTAAALLALGIRVAAAHAGNGAGFKLWQAEPVVRDFARWIAENVPPGGRLAFSGETDCALDWGKGAYLPVLAGREMMGDDYYGYPKGLTERNYPPRVYRSSTKRFLGFSRVWGVTHWAVVDPRTRRFCETETNHFALAASFPMQSADVRVYRILDDWARGDPTRFYRGEGEVEASENALVVRPADPGAAGPLVLRYRWRDGLRSLTPGAAIAPFDVDGNLRLVAVAPGGAPEVRIGYRPLRRPLAPDFDGHYHH